METRIIRFGEWHSAFYGLKSKRLMALLKVILKEWPTSIVSRVKDGEVESIFLEDFITMLDKDCPYDSLILDYIKQIHSIHNSLMVLNRFNNGKEEIPKYEKEEIPKYEKMKSMINFYYYDDCVHLSYSPFVFNEDKMKEAYYLLSVHPVKRWFQSLWLSLQETFIYR
jgi:hypothetical protein